MTHPLKALYSHDAPRRTIFALVVFGLVLHSHAAWELAERSNAALWAWSLAPYALGALLAVRYRTWAIVGALLLPALADASMHYSVFLSGDGEAAAIGLIAMPLWNLVLLMPTGAVIGWSLSRAIAHGPTVGPPKPRGPHDDD